jgi:hypothetical protein
MNTDWKPILLSQLGATLDMLENALRTCPPELWQGRLWQEETLQPGFSEFWYIASHALFWFDLYLTGSVEGFTPPEPFSLVELDPAGVLPDRVYTCEELITYLDFCRKKCRLTIETLTEENVEKTCCFSWGEIKYGELLLDTMRHVQEHTAQLNLFLGQKAGLPSRWVGRAKSGG